ncbi:hypothetical protein H8S95_14910 [Pontibacter sp. KCTC 32443]|uniref:hypothetical protein n=1 Tax=Pontibacter TaxID=323449 RepID=UPI00164E9EB7|nr:MULTISPECIES: hypothetical protein [Pontibacter]MBC5775368.1 hypothetical protein [Pontibacter sp. KCTC 32443]
MLQIIHSEELKTSTGKTFLKIKYNSNENWIYTDWIGYPTPENVAKGAIAYLEAMQANNLNRVLNDNRNLVGRWDNALDWVEQVWLPIAIKAGLKRFAHITHQDSLSFKAASIMQNLIRSHIEMRVFTDPEAAKLWLREHTN